MHHVTHVRFINPHTEGDRGYNNINFIVQKLALN